VADFKSGKAAALNFLKGQVLKLRNGKATPVLIREILERKLKGSRWYLIHDSAGSRPA